MKITDIIWLDDIVAKLEYKHAVEPGEVKEVLNNRPWFRFVEKGHRPGENVYAAFGQSEAGRYLIVYFVHKKDRRALILSTREMSHTERRTYEQR